jgi:hypothetical protein
MSTSSSDQNGLTAIPEEWRRSKDDDFLLANQPQAPIQTRAHAILIFCFGVGFAEKFKLNPK